MKKVLYLGVDPSNICRDLEILHYPVISLVPKKLEEVESFFARLGEFSYVLFTSKNSVAIFLEMMQKVSSSNSKNLLDGKCISIGPSTTKALQSYGLDPLWEAYPHTQEGIIEGLKSHSLVLGPLLYPRSSRARPLLLEYLQNFKAEIFDLYDTICQEPYIRSSLSEISEIIFTSPSTVDGFFQIFREIPEGVKVTFQGEITEAYFTKKHRK